MGPDDGYLSEHEALIKALKIEDNVLISGPLYGRDKLEAYACGKPVIASMVGDLKHLVVDGVTGLMVESGDVKQLSTSILSLFHDDCRAKEMSLRGRQFLKENFTIENAVDRLENLYEKVVSA